MSHRARRIPDVRVRACNGMPVRRDGEWVLYWMIAARRARWNFALQRAVEHAAELGRPLLVFEPLRAGYPWANDRHHRFVLEGMAENAVRFSRAGIPYYAYVEPRHGEGRGLLEALAARACAVITDDFPAFFLPRMVSAASVRLPVLVEAVDSNGLLPMRATDRVFVSAYDFRRHLQKNLLPHLLQMPKEDPFFRVSLPSLGGLPAEILRRWPEAPREALRGDPSFLASIAVDHSVAPGAARGGTAAAEARLAHFLEHGLPRYATDRGKPEEDVPSGLSPWLHFGHISVHEVFHRVAARERWKPEKTSTKATGQKAGWWGLSGPAEAFLDELVTWRELGFNFCAHREDYDRWESLPPWAIRTLEKHAADPRAHLYTPERLEGAETHDPLWNAAQRQLVREGRIHNTLRMLWGKKILEWSPHPREAVGIMLHLNNKYATDGRDPNSASGIFWVLGRYDRPWPPERPVFGSIRYMSSENTARKVRVADYLRRHGP